MAHQIATEILAQLGPQALAMMGTKRTLALPQGVIIHPGTGPKKVTAIRIDLMPSDTYTVRFYKGKGVNMAEFASVGDVHVDRLHTTITSYTGLYLSL